MGSLKNAFAVVIGVGADLKESVTDATAIYNILVDDNMCGYKEENVHLITEKKATKINILQTLTDLKENTDENSSILIFYSGHGGYHEGAQIYYLQPNDFSATNYIDAKDLREIINGLKSKRLVLFLDCCHAAGMFKEGIGINQTKLRDEELEANETLSKPEGLAQKIDNDQGISVVSSCRENQLSWIMDGDINSLFTKCLLQVLKAEHRTYFEDEFIRISEVVQYIFRKVPEIQPSQNPYVNLQIYDDFVLSYIPKNLQSNISHTMNKYADEDRNEKSKKELVTTFRESENGVNLLLFVHGFTGEASETFGKMPEFLTADKQMDGWDIKPLGYSPNVSPETGNHVWASSHDIDRLADYLATSMKYKFSKYKRVAIIAHGLAGLSIQKSLISMNITERNHISHVMLFNTPSLGLKPQKIEKLWDGKFKELSSDGAYIQNIRDSWNETFKDDYPFYFKVIAGYSDEHVSLESSLQPFEDKYCLKLEGDHFSVVKPKSQDDISYQLVLNALTGNDHFSQISEREEINLLLGDYDAIIRTLKSKSETLDKRGLRRLIFALEGMDRRDEIYDIVKNNKSIKNNSDFMGIIGGRYKRDYLTNFSSDFAEKSISYYEKGLNLSESQDNKEQIYYHAINLAFLSLVYKQDITEMKDFAKKAQNAAIECDNNQWKLATVAEANLYLNELEIAKDYYDKAANLADIRQKLSMYTNAYFAYTNLKDTVSANDEFIRTLKHILL